MHQTMHQQSHQPHETRSYSARSDTYSARSDTCLALRVKQRRLGPCKQIIVTDIPLHPGRSGPYGRRMTIFMVLVHRVRQQRPVRWTIAAAAVAPEVMGLAPTL
jgi:hypothetical protein